MADNVIEKVLLEPSDTMSQAVKKINENFDSIIMNLNGANVYQYVNRVIPEDGQTVCKFGASFVRNSHSLIVFLNGKVVIQNKDYVEISDKEIEFLSPLISSDEVYMVGLAVRSWATSNGDPVIHTGATFIPEVNKDGILSWTNDKGFDNPQPVDITGDTGATFIPAIKDGVISWTNDKGLENPAPVDVTGPVGATFTPSVSEDGVISWTNDKGLENPDEVNIMGPQGPQGEVGKPFAPKGFYETYELLQSSVTNPEVGDFYGVGESEPYFYYCWDGTQWVLTGKIISAEYESLTISEMKQKIEDGTADEGITYQITDYENEEFDKDHPSSLVVDDYLSETSKNALQNQVVTKALNSKLDKADVPSNPNLLINPDFKINQRGGTEWNIGTTHAYFVDRWYTARAVLSLTDDGLDLSWNGVDGSDGWIQQIVKSTDFFGRTITISFVADGTAYSIPVEVPTEINVSKYVNITGTRLAIAATNHGGKYMSVVLFTSSTDPVKIKWVKAELGGIATPFIPPNPAEELLKIQSMNDNGTPKLVSNNTLPTIMNSQMVSNPNLLINPDFKINQRGMTEYAGTGIYCVDRWYKPVATNHMTVTKLSSGISFFLDSSDNASDHNWIVHKFEETTFAEDTTVTLSVCAKGSFGIAYYGAGMNNFTADDYTIKSITYIIPAGTRFGTSLNYCPLIGLSATGEYAEFLWAKLELGSIATPFCPPDPATELAKCQRYFLRLPVKQYVMFGAGVVHTAINAKIMLPLPVSMRVTPTIEEFSDLILLCGTEHEIENALLFSTNQSSLIVSVDSSNLTVGNGCMLRGKVDANGGIAFSAEL